MAIQPKKGEKGPVGEAKKAIGGKTAHQVVLVLDHRLVALLALAQGPLGGALLQGVLQEVAEELQLFHVVLAPGPRMAVVIEAHIPRHRVPRSPAQHEEGLDALGPKDFPFMGRFGGHGADVGDDDGSLAPEGVDPPRSGIHGNALQLVFCRGYAGGAPFVGVAVGGPLGVDLEDVPPVGAEKGPQVSQGLMDGVVQTEVLEESGRNARKDLLQGQAPPEGVLGEAQAGNVLVGGVMKGPPGRLDGKDRQGHGQSGAVLSAPERGGKGDVFPGAHPPREVFRLG
ncbi:MAG: hypothetical protein BWY88_00165 [Synergistetes bacterium ADurb.Bin520]|nr:MAG: hypothetical protein BWY88_00165 [Synergistetes bacterium ADurb.Bin520]